MLKSNRVYLCGLSLLAIAGLTYAGPDWVEGEHGDAGSVVSEAQTTIGSQLRHISGKVTGTGVAALGSGGNDFQDLYLIRIDDPSMFRATTVPGVGHNATAEFDTRLWLFKADGTGLLGNDDTSQIPLLGGPSVVSGSTLGPFACDETEAAVIAPGLYYLGISKLYVPLSISGPIFNFDDQDQCGLGELSGPDGSGAGDPLVGWTSNEVEYLIEVQGGRNGNYSKAFTLTGDATFNPQVFSNAGSLADDSGDGDWNLNWNFGSDNDASEGQASMGSGFTVENTMPDVSDPSANHLRFTITLRMKLQLPTQAAALGGNAAITLLTRPSMSSNPGQLTAVSQPVWNALVNDDDAAALFAPSFQLTSPATPFTGSTAVQNATLGVFATSDEVESIGIRMHFDLTPGEKITVIGAFALLPMAPLSSVGENEDDYTIYLEGVTPAVVQESMSMDIKPGACPNPHNPGSNGVLPVSLAANAMQNVHDIVLSSVRLSRVDGVGGEVAPHEGPPGPHTTYQDNATPLIGEECECHHLTGDGITDLSMKFRSDVMEDVLELDSVPGGTYLELQLTGMYDNNTPFVARDCIRIVPPHLAAPGATLQVRCAIGENWIDTSPTDIHVDGGGFANFDRYFKPGTVVTLKAPAVVEGRAFKGWKINGKTMIRRNITTITIAKGTQTCEAIYEQGPVSNQ